MDAELKIKIGAETQQAESGIKKVTQALGNLKPGANQATFALTNLSRVAQDAPFGFIGIANNIEPLIQSFQSLRRESGSMKGAFSALASSMAGGGGLILLTGLVSTAMSLLGSQLFKTSSETKKAKDETDKYAESIGRIKDSIAKETAEVSRLVGFANDEATSREKRVLAIKKLQEIAPAYFGTLNAEKTSVEQLTKAYAAFSNNIVNSVKARIFQQDLEKIVRERLDIEEKIQKLGGNTKEVLINGQLVRVRDFLISKEKSSLQLQQERIKLLKTEADLVSRINDLEAPDLAKPTVTTNATKAVGKIFDPNQFLKENLVNFNEALYKLDQEAQKGFGEIGKNASAKLTETIGGNFNPESLATKLKEKLQASLNRAAELGIKLPDLSGFANDLSRLQFVDDAIAKFEILQGKAKQLGETVTNALSPAFDTFFKTLLDGSGNPFKAFGEALKQMIIQLTATIAKALLLRVIMSAINPAGTVGAAAGSTFGSFLKGALSGGIGGIANGGINVGGITGAANVGGQRLVAEVSGTSLKFLLDKTNGSVKRGF